MDRSQLFKYLSFIYLEQPYYRESLGKKSTVSNSTARLSKPHQGNKERKRRMMQMSARMVSKTSHALPEENSGQK